MDILKKDKYNKILVFLGEKCSERLQIDFQTLRIQNNLLKNI
jgi:hypothetical protein